MGGINRAAKLLYRQAGRQSGRWVRDYSVPCQRTDGESRIYLSATGGRAGQKGRKRHKEGARADSDEVKGMKRGAASETERGRNRGRQREHGREVFEYIRCLRMLESGSIDGVYLSQGFTEKFSATAAAGRRIKLELTDNQ